MTDSGIVAETVIEETETPAAPESETEPERLPDNHPLVLTLAKLRSEKQEQAQAYAALQARESNARAQAQQYQTQLGLLQNELVAAQQAAENNGLALRFGLKPDDAALLASVQGADAKQQLAQRLAANSTPVTGLPYVPELGRVVTTDGDKAAKLEKLLGL